MSIRAACHARRRRVAWLIIVCSLALRPELLRRIGWVRYTGAVLLLLLVLLLLRPRYTHTVRLLASLRLDTTLLFLLPCLKRVCLHTAV